MKQLQAEHLRLNQLLAVLMLDKTMLLNLASTKLQSPRGVARMWSDKPARPRRATFCI